MKRLDFLVEALLNEAIKLDSPDALFNAIKNKQIGVKLQPEFLQVIDKCKPEITILYNKLSSEVKNIQFPAGFLLKQISSQSQLRAAVTKSMDGIIEFAKNYNKPWVKELSSYKQLENATMFNSETWHTLEKDIQENSSKHGKAAKGSGNFNGTVKAIYSDDTWELYKVDTFEKEKAVAFYGENWDKPTHWCTRTQQHWFDNYTKNYGEKYLWVFRNKNGHAWQMAFNTGHIEFMDEMDGRPSPDGIKAFLKSLPDELCKKVTPNKGYTLYDIKNRKEGSNVETTGDSDSEVEIKISTERWSKGSIEALKSPTNWGEIKTSNTKRMKFPTGTSAADDKIYEDTFEMSDIKNLKVEYVNDKERGNDELEKAANGSIKQKGYVVKLIHAKVKRNGKDHYEIAVFLNEKSAAQLSINTSDGVKTSDREDSVCSQFRRIASALHTNRQTNGKESHQHLPSHTGPDQYLVSPAVGIKKLILKDPEYKKIESQIPFGEFKSVSKFSTLNKSKSPTVSFDLKKTPENNYYGDDFMRYATNYRIKNVFPKKVTVSFKNGNCYFEGGKMIFEPAVDELEEKEYELSSKEAQAVRKIYKIWLRIRFNETKPMYDDYKKQLTKQQLDSDHETWKGGGTRLRPLGRVYEELNEETSYFNY